MDTSQMMACPVCTLYLREGMSMHTHLETHPKDQVIEALVRVYTAERSQPLDLHNQQGHQSLLNPFQVVSEEHIFLGRQQVTNILHSPFMYPLYPQQQVLSNSEYGITPLDGAHRIGDSEPQNLMITAGPGPEQVQDYDRNDSQKIEECEERTEKNYLTLEQASHHGSDSPVSNHSENSSRTNVTSTQREVEFIGPDCDFQDEDARDSEDVVNDVYRVNIHISQRELDDDEEYVDNDLERSSSNLNIQADECMPARGELSGHGSTTANSVSALWLREEPMPAPAPIWQGPSPAVTKKKFVCLYCSEEFSCPKERRIHVATLHSAQEVIDEKKNVTQATVCTKCGLQLASALELKVHIKSEHINAASKQCGVCLVEFTTQDLYQDHILKVHPLECRTCGKTFHSKASLCAHAKCHLELKPNPCTLCPKSFITKQKLKEHMNSHTGLAPIQCNMCDKRFKRYSNLKQHKDSAHFKIKKKTKEFFCECGETFTSKKKLDWHKEIHDDKPKQCMYCSERYIHSTSLTRHIRRAHNAEYLPEGTIKKKNVQCPICNKVFIEASLRTHMQQHGTGKQYGCVVCGKKFHTKWNLHLHRWTHASRVSKPYKCTMCKGAFIRQSDLQAHIRAHYGNKPFTCNFCGMRFNRKHNWVRHEKEHLSEKRHTCNECGKTFHRRYYLVDHARTHTGVKPFSCHICNKTSSTKSNHNKHIKTHHARESVSTES